MAEAADAPDPFDRSGRRPPGRPAQLAALGFAAAAVGAAAGAATGGLRAAVRRLR